jgi:hypothetical protein
MKRVLLFLVAVFILLQFFQPDRLDGSGYSAANDFILIDTIDQEQAMVVKQACYDCHSDRPKYPWYSYVSPVSWWIQDHIDHARHDLNFTQWNTYTHEQKEKLLKECADEVYEGDMPLKPYSSMHSEAQLSADQRHKLVLYFRALR